MIERLVEAVEACDFTDSEGDDVIGEMAESILNRERQCVGNPVFGTHGIQGRLSIE